MTMKERRCLAEEEVGLADSSEAVVGSPSRGWLVRDLLRVEHEKSDVASWSGGKWLLMLEWLMNK